VSVTVPQLPQRDRGIPIEQRTRAHSEIGPTIYTQGGVIYPTPPEATQNAQAAGEQSVVGAAESPVATAQSSAPVLTEETQPKAGQATKPVKAKKTAKAGKKK
jgi:hypothetical protein